MPSISDAVVVDDAPIYLTGGALEVAVQAIPVDTQQIVSVVQLGPIYIYLCMYDRDDHQLGDQGPEKRAMRHLVCTYTQGAMGRSTGSKYSSSK